MIPKPFARLYKPLPELTDIQLIVICTAKETKLILYGLDNIKSFREGLFRLVDRGEHTISNTITYRSLSG